MIKEIIINHMGCNHCSGRVETALNNIEGVTAIVDLSKRAAYVTSESDIDDKKLTDIITYAGYCVVSISDKTNS